MFPNLGLERQTLDHGEGVCIAGAHHHLVVANGDPPPGGELDRGDAQGQACGLAGFDRAHGEADAGEQLAAAVAEGVADPGVGQGGGHQPLEGASGSIEHAPVAEEGQALSQLHVVEIPKHEGCGVPSQIEFHAEQPLGVRPVVAHQHIHLNLSAGLEGAELAVAEQTARGVSHQGFDHQPIGQGAINWSLDKVEPAAWGSVDGLHLHRHQLVGVGECIL